MENENYERLLERALRKLRAASKKLKEQTTPHTPMPRIREFEIVPGEISWPKDKENLDSLKYIEYSGRLSTEEWYIDDTKRRIFKDCQYQPRRILQAIRRIQAATAWCEARAEGRKRHAEEILRQQQKAVDALEAEAAMLALE